MKHLFRLVAILIIMLFQTSTAFAVKFEIHWTSVSNVTGYKVVYNLNGNRVLPFSGTGLTIGPSPANVGNVLTTTLGEFNENTTLCAAVNGYYADGSETSYSQVVCTTRTPSADFFENLGNNQMIFGTYVETGYCIPIINSDGTYLEGATSYTSTSHSVNFEKAPGDWVLYTHQAPGGTIYPLDFVVSYYYQPMEVSVTPDYGKCLTDLTDNGVSVIQNVSYGHYTIASPIINHTVIPTFGSCFTLTASASAGGSISPAQSSLDYMGSVTLTITEDEGNELTELTDNGVSVIGDVYLGQDELLKYDVSNANENHDVVATLEAITNGDIIIPSFGLITDTALVGDWNNDGKDEIGVARKGATYWSYYLDKNGNGVWDGTPTDIFISQFGLIGDTPMSGDWNNDGKDEIGVARKGTSYYSYYLDANGNGLWDAGVDITIPSFGFITDTVLVGDWNGDGKDEIGVARKGTSYYSYYLDANGNGIWEQP